MSNFLPTDTLLGKLRMVDILSWYDRPILFIAENASGTRYVAFWADEQENEDLWLYSPVSESRIASLVSGKFDLRSIYTDPEDGIIFLVRTPNDESSLEDTTTVVATVADRLDPELLPPHNDFLDSEEIVFDESDLAVPNYTDILTHEITINRPRSSKIIAYESLSWVASSWSKLLHAVLDEPPVLVGTRAGSLIVNLQTEAGDKLPNFFNRLRTLLSSPTPEQISTILSDPEFKPLEIFLESLCKEKLTLSIRITSQLEQPHFILSHSNVRDLRSALIDFNHQRIQSIDVPQADDLNKLFRMIELIKDGEDNLGYQLGLSPRQVAYYSHAARILGLLNESSSISSRGQYFTNLSQVDRYNVAMLLFESSPVGFAWLSFCGVYSTRELDPRSAQTFLTSQCPGLKNTTIGRRSQTLRYWVTAFQEQRNPSVSLKS